MSICDAVEGLNKVEPMNGSCNVKRPSVACGAVVAPMPCQVPPPVMTMNRENEIRTTSYFWYMVVILFFACLLGVLAVTIPVETVLLLNKLPKDIDVVLVDRSGVLARGGGAEQVALVDKNMAFRRNIYIMSDAPTGPASTFKEKNVFFSNFASPVSTDPFVSLRDYYLGMGSIVGIAEHAIFLGDTTFPYRKMDKTILFDGDRPRLFNFFKPTEYTSFFAPFLNETLPSFVQDTALFTRLRAVSASDRLQELLLLERTERGYTIHNCFNRDVMLNGGLAFAVNRALQFDELKSNKPVFATFHISGDAPTALAELDAHLLEIVS